MQNERSLQPITGSSIKRKSERLALLSVSIPVHTQHTAASEAIRLVFAEAMLSGAGKYTRDAFLDALSQLGSNIKFYTEDDTIEISLRSLDSGLVDTMQLLHIALSSPTFRVSEIRRIKRYVKNMLILTKEDARMRSYQQFVNCILPKSDRRYLFPIDTLVAEIDKVTVETLKDFHRSLFLHQWTYTSGGSSETVERIGEELGKLGSRITPVPEEAVYRKPQITQRRTVILSDIPHKQNIEFSIGALLPMHPNDPEYAAFVFGMSVLAIQGGFSGRLMSTVREKEGLTYMIYGKTEKATAKEFGFWKIATFFNPKDAVKGITSTLRQIELMQMDGITEDELKRFKSILKTRFSLREDSLIKRVAEAHALCEAGLSSEDYEAFKEKLYALTVDEVNEAMHNHLNPLRLVISGAGPVKKIKKDLKRLEII